MAALDERRLVADAERAGCRVRATKKGYLILCPNGQQVAVHWSESDHRSHKNTRARLRRNGVAV